MKALTIQQPYASLIVLPDDDDRAKRVENRTWGTEYRGPLLIHAGKGKEYLVTCDLLDPDTLPFGAIVGLATLAACVPGVLRSSHGTAIVPTWAAQKWPWLQSHEHTEGPVCWVLCECRALATPIPCKGERGLWTPSAEIVAAVREQLP